MKRFLLALLTVLAGSACLAPALASEEASIVRGGRLYDHWVRELQVRPPAGLHPLFSARRNFRTAADTWRCKECHGWDYNGLHGMPGIRGRQGADPTTLVGVLKNSTHRYGGLMGDADLLDLAQFVSHGQVDMQGILDTSRRVGNANASEKTYATLCGACHGLDGRRLREIAPLGETARQSPQEVLHVMLNGHPDRKMPALRKLGSELIARMLAYLQTLPGENLSASIAHGGRLYDNWQAEAGAERPTLPHPAYPPGARYANEAAQTWRCKECHGWDYKGREGAYADGQHATGIKGIRAMAGHDPARIITLLRDVTHRYDAVLKERDLRDLAQFVSAGQIDMDVAIDRRSGRARGDAQRAAAYYDTLCAVCHGSDGQLIRTGSPLGQVARTNPWESLHKMMNGHPDEKMPALREIDRHILVDILAFLQTLPEVPGQRRDAVPPKGVGG